MEIDDEKPIIVLHVAEGVNLNLNDCNVVVTASLGGNKLETEVVKVAKSTVFNCNLIWETDKKSIKGMKTENLPIKVECFAVKLQSGREIRRLIGYILMPIRGAPFSSLKKPIQLKPHWRKLIGLNSEWRALKPEILVFLTITDQQNLDQNGELINIQNPRIETTDLIPIEPCDTNNMLTSQHGLNIKLLQDEGLLQVGDQETDCDIFVFKLMFKFAKNLEYMMNSREQKTQAFKFHYNLFGNPAHCPLVLKGNGGFSIQENITINFRTSLKRLREYFCKVLFIPIDLYHNDTVIGHARFNFNHMIKIDELKEFLATYGKSNNTMEDVGTFPIEPLFDLPMVAPKPFVEYNFSLKYMSTTNRVEGPETIETTKPQRPEFIDTQAGGDHCDEPLRKSPPPNVSHDEKVEDGRFQSSHNIQNDTRLASVRESSIRNAQDPVARSARTDFVMPPYIEKTNIESLLYEKNECLTTRSIPKTFSFTLTLQMVKFSRRPEAGIWQVSLHHAKADTPFTVVNIELAEICSNVVDLRNLKLQLYFASTADDILGVIESEPCMLNINGPRGLRASAELDNEMLLVGTKERRSGVILLEDQVGEKVAVAHIFVYLDDLGISCNSQIKKYPKNPMQTRQYMDENLAYRIVEELEEWKAQHQEEFLIELKKKEVNHLGKLSSEWEKRKSEMETKLAQKLEQCTKLTATLEDANRAIKEKGIHQLEHERYIEEIRLELENTYSAKLNDIKEKAKIFEDDMNHKLKLEELKYRELEMTKKLVDQENEKLRLEINDLQESVAAMRENYFPREQLATLFMDLKQLTERLDEVQKSKMFYKDQWAKIIREVHKMKTENLRHIELQLRENQSVGLKEFLEAENSDLISERQELSYIKDALFFDNDSLEDHNFVDNFSKSLRQTNQK